MSETVGIDCAWTKPAAASIKAAGDAFAIGYLSPDVSKNLTPAFVADLHGQGLAVGAVWESSAARATQGSGAGQVDGRDATQQAATLGIPPSVPIYFAVDGDYTPGQVLDYFRGVGSTCAHPVGGYGSLRIVDGLLLAGLIVVGWQTSAWSGGVVSTRAHLYQRQKPTRLVAGMPADSYDEDVLLASDLAGAGLWLPEPAAPPTPVPAPASAATSEEDDDAMKDCYLREDSKGHVYYVNFAALIKTYLPTETEVGQWTFLLSAAGHAQNAVISPAPDNILAACATVQPGGLQA